MVHRVNELVKTYGVDGIYLDSTGCSSETGMRISRPGADGSMRKGPFIRLGQSLPNASCSGGSTPWLSIPIRIGNGTSIFISPNASILPRLANATIGWHGESLPHGGFRPQKALPGKIGIETEFTGDNVGTDIDMLVHSLLREHSHKRKTMPSAGSCSKQRLTEFGPDRVR